MIEDFSKYITYIIAEVGSNYTCFDDALDSIVEAKRCGADAVKFQMFTPMELYGSERYGDPHGVSRDWIPKLKEKADEVKIDFMCTAFSPEGVEFLNPFVVAHKIASSDAQYLQLLKAVKATGKMTYISTGGSRMDDIRDTIDYFGKDNLTVMYCRSEYPSISHDLRLINVIRDNFDIPVGYSCHTIDVYTPVAAVQQHGVECIEKHFKLRADMATPDAGHSLCPDQFSDMVRRIKDDQRLSNTRINDEQRISDLMNPDASMISRHNRRAVVTRKISKGESFIYGANWGYFRSRNNSVRVGIPIELPAGEDFDIGAVIN